MFKGLRENSTFYILEKSEKPTLKIGTVVSVTTPMPQFSNFGTTNFGSNDVVDVVVKVDTQEMNFKQLPASQNIANFGSSNVVVADSKDAINAELDSMITASKAVLDSVNYHKNVLECCDMIVSELNPQIAKEREQEAKITSLESRMGGIEESINDIKGMLMKTLNANKK